MTERLQPQPRGLHDSRHTRFWRGQVAGRIGRLVRDRVLLLSVLLAAATTAAVRWLPLRELKISEVAAAGLSFGSLAFGACVTGAVLSISLAPAERVVAIATRGLPGQPFSHYSDLIFVFTWSAMAQLGVVMASLIALAIGGGGLVGPAQPYVTHTLLVFLALSVTIYAVAQLFTVVNTISQLGVVIIAEANRMAGQQPAPATSQTAGAADASEP